MIELQLTNRTAKINQEIKSNSSNPAKRAIVLQLKAIGVQLQLNHLVGAAVITFPKSHKLGEHQAK